MKTYKLQSQNWVSEKPLTTEQKETIRANFGKPVKIVREYETASEETKLQLDEIWDANKPSEESYSLIDVSITLEDNGNFRGIINYRVKGEHLQKRF